MLGLMRGSAREVEKVLQADPGAAKRQLDEHNCRLPLCWAARNRLLSVEMLRLLLAHGANPKEEDSNGRSVLALLCAEPDRFPHRDDTKATVHESVWEIFSRVPTNPPPLRILSPEARKAEKVKEKPQMIATIPPPGLIEVVNCLLASGADPCQPDLAGDTPLTLVAAARCTVLVEMLRRASLAQARVALAVSAAAAGAAEASAPPKHGLQLKSLRETLVSHVLDFC